MILKKSFLITSFFTITMIALLYGVYPKYFFSHFLMDSKVITVDMMHLLRAIMGLYLALGVFWLYCAFNEKLHNSAIVVIALFCGGLASGRVLSILLDGTPSPILIVYLLMELSLIPICLWLLSRD